jgi:hypothetical protein
MAKGHDHAHDTIKDTDILINVLLDRSGSMNGLEKDVIGHFNSYIKEQAELPGRAWVSLVLFDDKYEEVYINKRIQDVPKLTPDTYYVRGSTAYLDALGRLIKSIDKLKDLPNKVIFVINTDGYENASKEFTPAKIKEMVEERRAAHDWQFVFIGAGIDAINEASKYGFVASASLGTSSGPAGQSVGYGTLRSSTTNYRTQVSNSMDMTNTVDAKELDEKKKKTTSNK